MNWQTRELLIKISILVCLVVILMFVGGCASTTLEELEAEALQTGDWTEVERREARINFKRALADAAAYCNELDLVMMCRSDVKHRRDIKYISKGCTCTDISTVLQRMRRW